MTTENKIERREKILKGLEKAYEKMLEFKRKNNSEIVIIKENKIVKTLRSTHHYKVKVFLIYVCSSFTL